jgi:hypothetical protein
MIQHLRYKGVRGGPMENSKKHTEKQESVSKGSDRSSQDANKPAALMSEEGETADETSRSDSNKSSKGNHTDSSSDTLGSKANNNNQDRYRRMLHKQCNKIKELECKVITQACSGYKAQPPELYKGEKNYDKFEQFVYDYDNWCIDTYQKESSSMRLVSWFLRDKAAQWYMASVAPRQGT